MVDPSRFRPALLAGRESAGGGLTRITIEPDPALPATYARPGQYIEVLAGGETGFFVLSSDPGARPWELVMRSGGGASDVLLAAPVGTPLEATVALGEGFPVEQARGGPLVVAMGGTGVAAGPPVVRRRVRDGDAALTHAFVGIRGRGDLPLEAELRAWRRAGVSVVACWSEGPWQPQGVPAQGESPDAITLEPGFVQDVLARRLSLEIERGSHGAPSWRMFAVGPDSMLEGLRLAVKGIGLDPSRVHTNY